jgi:uroporphyrinogen-III synthase
VPALPVLVTRPREEAQRWVEQLQAAGVQAEALPLIEISPMLDAMALAALWQDLEQCSALMFVSGNAVAHFFAGGSRPWPAHLRCLAPGPGTARALLGQGVPASLIDSPPERAEQFDSEALWRVIASQPWQGRRVRIVRGLSGDEAGSSGRDWLAQQLRIAGAQVDAVAVYRRGAPHFDARQRARMLAAQDDGSLWLFSSSEAITHLPADLNWTRARALVTHPRIAEAARHAGFGSVRQSRPTLADVLASIESTGP